MNESQIKELGYKLVDSYKHDNYKTNRYKKGSLYVEFTYEGKERLTHDLTISEINCMPISYEEVKAITELIGHWEE